MGDLIGDDAINKALLRGLREAFADELRFILREEAEKKVEDIVREAGKRLEAYVSTWPEFSTQTRHIKLEMIFKRKEEGANG